MYTGNSARLLACVTSQATAPDLPTSGGDSSILQSIQYRKTGVLLDITAVVHSGQRVDIKLTQEVSEASTTDTSDISSPSIFSRKLQTSLSLQDGESTLLGGLISRSHTAGKLRGSPADGVGNHWWYQLTAADFRACQLPDPAAGVQKPTPW